jgi:hypothetical protein
MSWLFTPFPSFHGDGGTNPDKSQWKTARQREKWRRESLGRREWLVTMGLAAGAAGFP